MKKYFVKLESTTLVHSPNTFIVFALYWVVQRNSLKWKGKITGILHVIYCASQVLHFFANWGQVPLPAKKLWLAFLWYSLYCGGLECHFCSMSEVYLYFPICVTVNERNVQTCREFLWMYLSQTDNNWWEAESQQAEKMLWKNGSSAPYLIHYNQ